MNLFYSPCFYWPDCVFKFKYLFTSTAEGKCAKRNLDFKNRDHYTFTADGSKGKAIKALQGSGP